MFFSLSICGFLDFLAKCFRTTAKASFDLVSTVRVGPRQNVIKQQTWAEKTITHTMQNSQLVASQ